MQEPANGQTDVPRWPAMRQHWLHLLFVHWPVAPGQVQRLLPSDLTVELFEGQAWVGLVPFTIRGTRPPGLPPLPIVSSFHEINLRTYVRRDGDESGVWFFSLDAASRLAVVGARVWYRLAYHFSRIRLAVERHAGSAGPSAIAFESERLWPGPRPAGCALLCAVGPEPPKPAEPETLESFLIERYVLYSGSAGRLRKARVAHRPYPIQPAQVERFEQTLSAAAGLPETPWPHLAHYSPGVSVRISRPFEPA